MKVKFKIKAQDDAIQEQGQIINDVTRSITQFLHEFDRWLQMPVEVPEFNVNLSDQSPFKKLDNKQIKDWEQVEKVWKEFPRFMYTDDELAVFEKEFGEIQKILMQAAKKSLANSLNKTIGFIKTLSDDEKVKEDLKRTSEFNKRIEARAKKVSTLPNFPKLPDLASAKSLADLAVILQPFVQTLKA